jgi:integrase
VSALGNNSTPGWSLVAPAVSLWTLAAAKPNWRLRILTRFGNWPIARMDHESTQRWVNEMSASGLSPRTV